MPDPIQVTVYGIAQPAGSKRAFAHKHTGRIIVTDANPRSRTWKQEVAGEAVRTMNGRPPLEGPLTLNIVFWLPRPKSHSGTKGIRPSAPRYPAGRPDTTKLIRAVEDALTGITWHDDAQIVYQQASKRYADNTGPCVAITISEAT